MAITNSVLVGAILCYFDTNPPFFVTHVSAVAKTELIGFDAVHDVKPEYSPPDTQPESWMSSTSSTSELSQRTFT
jgi:hypothetical protein